ncbi:MAG TPA: DUF2304 domain-containing protein [Candidatus Binatia bacterium]|nr:DUF2304 domain-containing protein [Candidatus Binatia bacterium]
MVSVIIATLVIIALYVGTKRLSGLETLAVVAIAVAGIVLAIFPVLSQRVANSLHVGRGTDLVFYFAVLAGLFVASNFYFRFKRHEEALIALARQNAIERAQEPQPVSAPDSGAEGDRAVE